MQKPEEHTLTMLVDHRTGVLDRITSQIRREGWNIRSLSAASTNDPAIARLTLSGPCRAGIFHDTLYRLKELNCVHEAVELQHDGWICLELCLLMPLAPCAASDEILRRHGAAKQDDTGVWTLVAHSDSVDACMEELSGAGPFKMSRTGVITLCTGEGSL